MYNTKHSFPDLPCLGTCRRVCWERRRSNENGVARRGTSAKTTRYRVASGFQQVEEDERETLEVQTPTTLFRRPSPKEWFGLMELARIHNYAPSCLLVLFGAWKCVGWASVFAMIRVWATAFVAGGVALGSVIANDYFDFLSGIDGVNAPSKPLPSGIIRPDVALLITLGFYISVLVAGCLMEPPLLRWIIALSATSTFLYTPLLKSLTLVKNFAVAFVIALSPISGAVASGTGVQGAKLLLAPSAFVFGSVVFREILMDIKDARGDEAAHVYTLPVVTGKSWALVFALFSLTLGSLRGWLALKSKSRLPYHFSIFILMAVISPLYWSTWRVWKHKFDEEVVQHAVDSAMLYIAFGFLTILVLT